MLTARLRERGGLWGRVTVESTARSATFVVKSSLKAAHVLRDTQADGSATLRFPVRGGCGCTNRQHRESRTPSVHGNTQRCRVGDEKPVWGGNQLAGALSLPVAGRLRPGHRTADSGLKGHPGVLSGRQGVPDAGVAQNGGLHRQHRRPRTCCESVTRLGYR